MDKIINTLISQSSAPLRGKRFANMALDVACLSIILTVLGG